MEKEMKKERIALAISRALATISVIAAITLLSYFLVRAKNLGVAEYLAMLIPVGFFGSMMTAVVIFMIKDIREQP